MKKIIIMAAVVFLGMSPGKAQASTYFQAVTNLNPVGYWPMHEVEAAAPGDIETNYGTLGALANGYYPDWVTANVNTNVINHQVPGALAGDSDTAAYFGWPGGANAGTTSNALYVPITSPLTTLNPPFSVECWFKASGNAGDIWSQNGYEGLNAGTSGSGSGSVGGIRLYWLTNATFNGFVIYSYAGSSALQTLQATGNYITNQWYHVIVTDDGTNINLIVNGNNVNNIYPYAHAGHYTPDYWTPFEVGNGRGNSRACKGFVDEVAIYTNVLQDVDVTAHYSAGTNSSPSPSYKSLVLADNPVVYLRMDGPAYSAPTLATWPVLTNYGSVGVNGVYSPGTVPGIVSGPNLNGVSYAGVAGLNVPQFSGVSSFADVGYSPAYNPTGATPFTVAALFRGNPCDNRFQTIVGHSDNSWRIAMATTGKLQCQLGTNTTSTINSAKVYNDGNWHQMFMVYQPASIPTITGTNALYVDGVLDSSINGVSANGILPGTNSDVLIAADPQYISNPVGVGRQFAGQVCEVALFTNALAVAQIGTLYNAIGVPPSIKTQPVTGTANQGGQFTNTVVVRGSLPLSFQWYLNSLAYPGQTNASLILNPVKSTDAGNYYVVITNISSSVTSSVVTLTVNSSPTILSQLPLAYTNQLNLLVGANPTLSVTASGVAPIYYQWFSNNVAIAGDTNASFTLTNAQASSSGSYYCVASNFVGTTSNTTLNLSVVTPGAPYPLSVMALNPVGYWRLNEGPDDGNGDQNAVCFDYARGNNGLYTNVTIALPGYNPITGPLETSAAFGTTGYWYYDSYVGGVAGANFATQSSNSFSFTVEAWESSAPLAGNPDQAIVSLENYGNGGEQFVLDIHSGFYRFFVRDASGTAHAVSSTISPVYGQWNHLAGVCDESNGVISLYVNGALASSGVIASGSGILAVTNLMSIGSRISTTNTTYNDQLHGNVNDVAVYRSALSATQVAAQYFGAGIAPSFTQPPPQNVSVNYNGTLNIPATVTGTSPLACQWYDANTSLALAGQTNATLVISNISSSDGYDLMVTNLYGSTNSATVSVTLYSGAPVIIQNLPPSVPELVGRAHTYAVVVQGTEPFSYTWYKNSSPIAGQTASSYTFSAASGSYSVAITNTSGGVVSTVSTMSAVTSPTGSYSTNILGINPAGYWPLQETNAPAAANMETNYGSLGALATAYYAGITATNVTFGHAGALTATGDNDSSVGFPGGNTNSYLFVPLKSPAMYLQPPLTFECWVDSTSTTLADLMGNGGANGDGSGNWSGLRITYNPGFSGGPTLTAYTYPGSGSSYNQFNASANSLSVGSWNYCVMTYDGTNLLLYVDGVLQGGGTTSMATNYWTPLTIGTGRWDKGPSRGYAGLMDEVAVYTNVLSSLQISNHYLSGITSGSNYIQTVLNDQPLLYYRMDNAYTSPSPTAYPTALNFGTAPVNGAYDSGIVPGGVSGPAVFGINAVAAPINGVYSCVDAGYDPAFNPTGSQPFTAMTWFRTYPSDERFQTIMGQGKNWAMNLNTTNAGGQIMWNLSNGGQVTSTNSLNDGQWHFVAGVYDGTNSYLYMDGALNNFGVATDGLTGETTADLFLGGDADYTFEQNYFGSRYFAGAIAQAAFYTNALSAVQISKIYNVAAIPIINLSYSGGQIVINYTGTLLSSTNVAGLYAPVIGATPSPYLVTPSGVKVFYRTSNP